MLQGSPKPDYDNLILKANKKGFLKKFKAGTAQKPQEFRFPQRKVLLKGKFEPIEFVPKKILTAYQVPALGREGIFVPVVVDRYDLIAESEGSALTVNVNNKRSKKPSGGYYRPMNKAYIPLSEKP